MYNICFQSDIALSGLTPTKMPFDDDVPVYSDMDEGDNALQDHPLNSYRCPEDINNESGYYHCLTPGSGSIDRGNMMDELDDSLALSRRISTLENQGESQTSGVFKHIDFEGASAVCDPASPLYSSSPERLVECSNGYTNDGFTPKKDESFGEAWNRHSRKYSRMENINF